MMRFYITVFHITGNTQPYIHVSADTFCAEHPPKGWVAITETKTVDVQELQSEAVVPKILESLAVKKQEVKTEYERELRKFHIMENQLKQLTGPIDPKALTLPADLVLDDDMPF